MSLTNSSIYYHQELPGHGARGAAVGAARGREGGRPVPGLPLRSAAGRGRGLHGRRLWQVRRRRQQLGRRQLVSTTTASLSFEESILRYRLSP